MLKETDIWKLMARTIFGEASPGEKARLQEYLKSDSALQQQFEILSNTLKSHSDDTPADNLIEKHEIRSIIEKANKISSKTPVLRPVLRKFVPLAAASVILLVLAGWLFFFRNSKPVLPVKEKPAFVAQRGARNQITLRDGTKVWLNSDSKLFYSSDFKGATREVRLEGEAFFDVIKNASKPFIVHADNIDIKVLGTAFNVRAYTNDESVETTLYRGLVNIIKTDDKTFQPIMLYPNQKIIVPHDIVTGESEEKASATAANSTIKKSIAIKQIDSAITEPQRIETAWMYNRLEFRGDPLAQLAYKLERWYNVKITFEDENVKQLSFNGSFEKENVQQALRALSIANPFNYKIKNNEIFISSKK